MSINSIAQELKLIKKQIEINSDCFLKSIPEQWEDFVALTTIRSGGEMKKFVPYHYQKVLSQLMDEYNNIVVVKSRQLGLTQLILSKFLHRACINPAYSAMCFMRNGDDASAISRRAKTMIGCLGDYVTEEIANVGYRKFKGLGEIYFKNSSREGSRSYDSVLDFLFDEAAFVEHIEQIYAASSPSGALAGDAITKLIVSTPSAKSGWYWDKVNADNEDIDIEELCIRVAEGELYKEIPGLYWFVDKANTVKLIVHWKAHPIYSQMPNYLEYRMQQDGTDMETISREYDLRFIDSAVAVFSSEIIRLNAVGAYEETIDKDSIYYAGLDTSTIGNDYCVLSILKERKGKYSLVYLYRKRQQTSEYHQYQIGEILKKFRPRVTSIEITGGVGLVYLEQLSRQFPSLEFEAIRTTGDSKPAMISTMVLALEKQVLKYPSNCPLIDEMLSFRRDGKKLEAAPGKHDDCVMSVAFALAVTPFNKQKTNPFAGIEIRSI
ncbi:terminase family protein [Scytonema sp. UIC 10036]|uniref:phage terminase large subunit family protein n=1 Tax=Scytonema sp. UIC 10036 TaxID=2304196 RepID=UPI00140FCD20|nr:terminase family protein [Scytonema sp. UIC 10036]